MIVLIDRLALWGLDCHGQFKTGNDDDTDGGGIMGFLHKKVSRSQDVNISTRVLQDLMTIQQSLVSERDRWEVQQSSDREKGKRLLYLFQCDLLPGVSGKILEAKGQRDFATVRRVHPAAKIAGWSFILLLNSGMLGYILLFALTQSNNRQGAWAASFAVWLFVEILLVSSLIVLMVHVLLPSLILKDVTKIKQKLVENIREFNRNMKKKNKTAYEEEEAGANFNAADYLFLSTRLAKELPDLKEAKIIAQFKTPWPKQSYQHVTNVSKAYSKKFSAITRSSSILLIFVITTFLNVPPSVQDMVMQMLSTVVVGYVALLHIELFIIFPVLVVLPLLIVGIIVHFFIQSSKAQEKLRMQKLMKELEPDVAEIHPKDEQDGDFWTGDKTASSATAAEGGIEERNAVIVSDEEESSEEEEESSEEEEEDEEEEEEEEEEEDSCEDIFASNVGPLHTPLYASAAASTGDGGGANSLVCSNQHVTRRQSIQQGIKLMQQVQESLGSGQLDDESEIAVVAVGSGGRWSQIAGPTSDCSGIGSEEEGSEKEEDEESVDEEEEEEEEEEEDDDDDDEEEQEEEEEEEEDDDDDDEEEEEEEDDDDDEEEEDEEEGEEEDEEEEEDAGDVEEDDDDDEEDGEGDEDATQEEISIDLSDFSVHCSVSSAGDGSATVPPTIP